MNGWVSPRLGIRFQLTSDNLEIFSPSGERFLTYVELAQLMEQERQHAEQERQRADEALSQLEQERQRYQALEALLRERGIDPEQL
jgi:geranylgeranyl pyrophosphate synthase